MLLLLTATTTVATTTAATTTTATANATSTKTITVSSKEPEHDARLYLADNLVKFTRSLVQRTQITSSVPVLKGTCL